MSGLVKLCTTILISASQCEQAILYLPVTFLGLITKGRLTGISGATVSVSRGGSLVHSYVIVEWEDLLLLLYQILNAFVSTLNLVFGLFAHRDNAADLRGTTTTLILLR